MVCLINKPRSHKACSSCLRGLAVGITLLIATTALAQTADTILVNGKIVTVDAQLSTREAMAIRDGRIVSLGTSADMRKLADAVTGIERVGVSAG